METMEELTAFVCEKAKSYVLETGEEISTFPMSIVDFVIEHISNSCHFPKYFSEKDIVSKLSNGKNSLAMACVEIYARSGAEGQTSHSENGISRAYDGTWISSKIYSAFPNYVSIL